MKDVHFRGRQEHIGQQLLGASLGRLLDCQQILCMLGEDFLDKASPFLHVGRIHRHFQPSRTQEMGVYLGCPSELLASKRKDVIVAILGPTNVCSLLPATQETQLSNGNRGTQRFSAARKRWSSHVSPKMEVLRRSPSKLSGARDLGRDVIIAALPLAKTHRRWQFFVVLFGF